MGGATGRTGFTKRDQVIILDYKSSPTQSPEHEEQVLSYKALFHDMAYQRVSAYLFYALSGQLKSAEAIDQIIFTGSCRRPA